jgi:hypothetical protein
MLLFRLCIRGMLIFITLLRIADSNASDCGVLRFEKARSNGADILSNSCQDAENLALDSVLQIGLRSRVWLESMANSKNASKFQIICQNESALPVKIKVNSAFLPWLKPDEGFIKCPAWTHDRLECTDTENNKAAFVCAIALKKIFLASHQIQRTASVIMRNGGGDQKGQSLSDIEVELLHEILENGVNPKINLCENLFNKEISIKWIIETGGHVTQASILNNNQDDQFSRCALKAIETYTFPSFPAQIQITTSFK